MYWKAILRAALAILLSCGVCACAKEEIVLDTAAGSAFATQEEPAAGDAESDGAPAPGESASGDMSADREENICYVYLCGAVKCPGVYEAPAGTRLFQLIEQAGGLLPEAAAESLNLAELVEDGVRVRVPTLEEAAAPEAGVENKAAEAADGRLNINTADSGQLMTLPGIGEAKAAAIIAYREAHGAFNAPEELKQVEGIKDGVYRKIEGCIKIR